MKDLKIKVIMFALAMFFSVASVMAQTSTVKHTVQRGETLATIAQKYGTTEEKIKELNPEAAQFIYVGMELNIPERNVQNKVEIFLNSNNAADSLSAQDENNSDNQEETSYRKWAAAFSIGYGFLPKEKGVKGTNWAYECWLGANYNITKSHYVGARIGYNSSNYSANAYGVSTESEFHFVSLPIETGYELSIISDKFSIIPYGGFSFNYCVKGKSKIGKTSNKLDVNGEVGIDARLGARLSIYGFKIGAAYIIPVNDKQEEFFGEKAYFQVSIGF